MSAVLRLGCSWVLGPIDQEPGKALDSWSVYQIDMGRLNEPATRHLVGLVPDTFRMRVSTPVIRFDPAKRRALTQSGRVYSLAGRADVNGAGLYVWHWWKCANHLPDGLDVTRDVLTELAAWIPACRV
jgi:hypothetical protein